MNQHNLVVVIVVHDQLLLRMAIRYSFVILVLIYACAHHPLGSYRIHF